YAHGSNRWPTSGSAGKRLPRGNAVTAARPDYESCRAPADWRKWAVVLVGAKALRERFRLVGPLYFLRSWRAVPTSRRALSRFANVAQSTGLSSGSRRRYFSPPR